ncbi:DUF1679 domain-containing protein [Alteromonadaceae bacterium M269]|nr:DUF1679 domain-containing protein [Alteromonadaceae bacterium M269]
MDLITELRHFLNTPDLQKVEQVQALWSGYGEIARYAYTQDNKAKHIIVKHVQLPDEISHPRGWNTQTSHQRKISSYQNEEKFYADYAHRCDQFCYVPKHLGSLNCGSPKPLIIEDLDAAGFDLRLTEATLTEIQLGIRWLAYFHARFIDIPADDLWPVGTYWHLATRQDEWHKMAEGELKQSAHQIDSHLNNAKYQTLVHGDAKLANFCWTRDTKNLAAVDFQYIGKGAGVKDVMYFLGSCLNSNELFEHESDLLDQYFGFFHQALKHYQKMIDGQAVEREWRSLYPLAWADFHRFLQGWHPEHFKINDYMQKQTIIAFEATQK